MHFSFKLGNRVVFKNWKCTTCEDQCFCYRDATEVEVLILTFNHEETIEAALASVLNQSLPAINYSIYVHDDASSDETVIRAISTLDSADVRWTVVQQEKNQFSKTKFRFVFDEIKASKSIFLAFLEGDDYWSCPDKLTRQVDFMRSDSKANLCHSRYFVKDEESKATTFQPDSNYPIRELQSPRNLRRENYVGALTAVIRVEAIRESLLDFSSFDFEVADYPLWLAATSHVGSKIGFDSKPLATYRIHGKNYWATRNFLDGLEATKSLNRRLEKALGFKVGMSKARFVSKVIIRRLLKHLIKAEKTT